MTEPQREFREGESGHNQFREFYLDFLSGDDKESILALAVKLLKEKNERMETLTEYEERYVDHLQRCVRNLGKGGRTDKIKELVKELLEEKKKLVDRELKTGKESEFEDIFPGLDERQIALILRETQHFQLNKGCSVACARCGLNRVKKVRNNISWQAFLKIVDILRKYNIAKVNSSKGRLLASYMSTDSIDYRTKEGHTIVDANNALIKNTGVPFLNMTKVPRGGEETTRQMWETPSPIIISAFSRGVRAKEIDDLVYGWDQTYTDRTSELRDQGEDKLVSPIGRSYNGNGIEISIISSNACDVTPEGSFSAVPTSVNPIYPDGYARFDISEKTRYITKFETFSSNLPQITEFGDNYFLPLKVVDMDTEETKRMSHLLEPQIVETIIDEGVFIETVEGKYRVDRHKVAGSGESTNLRGFFEGNKYHTQFYEGTPENIMAFYLEEIKRYLLSHKREHKILQKVKRDNPPDGLDLEKDVAIDLPAELQDIFLVSGADKCKNLQIMIYWRLQDPGNPTVQEVIDRYKSKFDPEKSKHIPETRAQETEKEPVPLTKFIGWFDHDKNVIRHLPSYEKNANEKWKWLKMSFEPTCKRLEEAGIAPEDLNDLRRISELVDDTDEDWVDRYGYRYAMTIIEEYEKQFR